MNNMTTGLRNLETMLDERSNDGYEQLLNCIRKSFIESVAKNEPLFTTDVENLYDRFLERLPEHVRQHYNCNACRHFVNHYGGLVRIDEDGKTYPVMWQYAPDFFIDSVVDIRMTIGEAKVNGVFITSEKRLGTPRTGIWFHMSVDTPKSILFSNRLNTANQMAAKKNENFRMLLNAVNKYDVETVEQAVNLLRSDSMYRGEKFLGIAEWFLELKKKIKRTTLSKFNNIIWRASALAPEGFCHVSSSMIGTLLDDIREGYDIDTVRHRFNEKMDPLKYFRSQVNPGIGNVKRAEEIVAKLGIENSLKRRFARLDELKTVWRPSYSSSPITSGVFSGIETKNRLVDRYSSHYSHLAPATTMTWEKFQRTVLPMAKKIDLYVNRNDTNNYSAIVTAEDRFAPPIIKWDSEEHRNPFSWYMYNRGSYPESWNLFTSGYVEVTGITLQPNMWYPGFEHVGKGVFFILRGCKDVRDKSLGMFPEILRGELREVRSTIEAYSNSHSITGCAMASACGLCLQSASNHWKCELRVTTNEGVNLYKLDRWD